MIFLQKIIKAINENVLIYRVRRYFKLKIGYKKNLNDYTIQIYEDKIFYKILECFRINSFFQIGIGDPDLNRDPLYKFIIKKKLKGTVIEPHPILFQKLQKYYENNLKLDCLVGDQLDKIENFFYVDEKFLGLYEDYAKTISSVNKEHLIEHKILPKHIINKKTKSKTISSILNDNKIMKFDLLFLDVEGFEYKILRNFLENTNFYPCIVFEWRHFKKKDLLNLLEEMELKYNYKFITFRSDLMCFTNSNLLND